MPSYSQIMEADLSKLQAAATEWGEMADEFRTLSTSYRDNVLDVARNGRWTGISAGSAFVNFTATEHEYKGAESEARTVGRVLTNAANELLRLVNDLKGVVADAEKAGMHVSGNGTVTVDETKIDTSAPSWRNDPDVRTGAITGNWANKISDAVQAVTDADFNARITLLETVKDRDGKGHFGGFNSDAATQWSSAQADRATELTERLNADGPDGLKPAEQHELQRIVETNQDDVRFSRTLLNNIGPEGLVKLSNTMAGMSDATPYDGAGQQRRDMSGLQTAFANTLATATKDTDSRFYREWRADMKAVGTKGFDTNFIDPDGPTRKTAGDKAVGYQSLVTLMKHGDGYGKDFLHHLADDMREKEDPSKGGDKWVWSIPSEAMEAENREWFANDPLDDLLGIMSKNPDAATSYLDPGEEGKNDRLDYFLKERNWENILAPHGNTWWTGGSEDPDARAGLGDLLEASTTGRPPLYEGEPGGAPGPHTPAEARIMQELIVQLDEDGKGKEVPENLQQNIGRAMADYLEDNHHILTESGSRSGSPDGRDEIWTDGDEAGLTVSKQSLLRVMRGVSDDPETFELLRRSHTTYAADVLASSPPESGEGHELWKMPARDFGTISGTFSAITSDVIYDKRDDKAEWIANVARYGYHGLGTPITAIPVFGDLGQRLIDATSYEWQKEADQAATAESLKDDSNKYSAGVTNTYEVIDGWAEDRGVDTDERAPVTDGPQAAWGSSKDAAKTSFVTARTDAGVYFGWK